MNYLIFAGQSSLDHCMAVEHCPSYPAGQRSVTKATIPGRNGDEVQDDGTYANVVQPYDVWFNGQPFGGFNAGATRVANWLLGPKGYQRLEDSYDPETYRMALYTGPMDITNWMLRRGRATLEFDCKPERWLKAGQIPVTVASGEVLYNAWREAKPLLYVTGNGTLNIGTKSITISGTSGEVTIDCDVKDAWQGLNNLNGNIEVANRDWPTLPPGETTVTYSGFTSVKIVPRWWRL